MYTPNEVADMLKVSPATVRNMIRRGHLPATKFPGTRGIYRIPATALNALLDTETQVEVRGSDLT